MPVIVGVAALGEFEGAGVPGTIAPSSENGDKERQVMEEFCAYCGEEIVGEGVHQNDNAFCSQECLDAFNEEELLFMEEDERDDF